MGAEGVTTRDLGVMSGVKSLEMQAGALNDVVDKLSARLQDVVIPSGLAKEVPHEPRLGMADRAESAHACELHTLARTIQTSVDTLRDLVGRLDL